MRTIKRIIVHYTGAAASQTVESIQRYWKQAHPDWKGTPGYHVIIAADGTATRLQPDEKITYGVAGFNATALHVCFIGDGAFTAAQEATLLKRVRYWKGLYPHAAVVGHRDLSPDRDGDGLVEPHEWLKACPGFDTKVWCKANAIKQTA